MEYVILIALIALIAVLIVNHHVKDIKEDPVENWEPPKELHIHHEASDEKAKK